MQGAAFALILALATAADGLMEYGIPMFLGVSAVVLVASVTLMEKSDR